MMWRMKQTSFASLGYAGKKRRTRRVKFLGEMDKVVPWARLEALIEPHYPKSGRVNRPPIGLGRMLRMYFLQRWYSLSDEVVEDALCDSHAMREFASIDLARERVPDATTLLKFCRLLEEHELSRAILEEVNQYLSDRGLLMRQGTVVDATIIAAPSSTKNSSGKRDPEMHQTKKGNQWHYGMKMHIGVDADSSLVHSVHATAANEADVAHAHELLHGNEEYVHGDAGYTGIDKRAEVEQAQQDGLLCEGVSGRIAMKRGVRAKLPPGPLKDIVEISERLWASRRAIVEHPFHVIKNLFGYRKVSYRGIAKNEARACVHAALAYLEIGKRRLLAGVGAS